MNNKISKNTCMIIIWQLNSKIVNMRVKRSQEKTKMMTWMKLWDKQLNFQNKRIKIERRSPRLRRWVRATDLRWLLKCLWEKRRNDRPGLKASLLPKTPKVASAEAVKSKRNKSKTILKQWQWTQLVFKNSSKCHRPKKIYEWLKKSKKLNRMNKH